MKKILLFAGLLVGSYTANAQLSCSSPQVITTNGVINAPAITGTYVANCYGDSQTKAGGPMQALWYSFTAVSNGELTISSDLPTNVAPNSINTSLSVLSVKAGGSPCNLADLSCAGTSDDISKTNTLSKLLLVVEAGQTYYIVWDNFWSNAKFDFSINYVPISCMKVYPDYLYVPSNITTTSATLAWDKAIGNPDNYQYDWSLDLNAAAGTGTIVNVPAGANTYVQTDITLPAGSNFRYFIRSNCGTSQSDWTGPFYGNLATTLPYSNNFDATLNPVDGFYSSSWGFLNSATLAQSGTGFMYSQTSTTAATSNQLFTRAISLQANENVTLKFNTALISATNPPTTPSSATLKIHVSNDLLGTGSAQIGSAITIPASTTYVQRTSSVFTAPTAGVYYFVFSNETPMIANAGVLLLDTVSITSTLAVNEYLSSQFSVYPNPAKNVVTFTNGVNALINTIDMTDLNGRVVKSLNVNANEGQISISDLASGIYMMRISTDQGMAVKKIVKE